MIVPRYSFPKDPFERMDITPEVYRNRVLQMANEYIDSEKTFCEEKLLSSIDKRLDRGLKHLDDLDNQAKVEQKQGRKTGAWIGFIIGIILGIIISTVFIGDIRLTYKIDIAVGTAVVCLFIGRAIGNSKNMYEQSAEKRQQQRRDINKNAQAEKDKSLKDSSARCDKCKTEAVAVIEQYTHVFESEARKLSLEYLESPAINDIANWIADEFAKDILRIDRPKTVESFGIYLGIITRGECVALYAEGEEEGVYRIFDFNEHRYPQLDSVLRIAAVAKVLTQAVLMILVERYPEDVAGGATQIELKSEEYAEDAVLDHIRYSAVNGNYEPIMHW